MSDQPLHIDRHISLITTKPLDPDDAKAWYHCVQAHAPSGVVISVPATDDQGDPKEVRMVHRVLDDDRHAYLVPLRRDLSDKEVETIVHAFADEKPSMNFDVETNETRLLAKDYCEIPLDAAKHLALCTALAKHRHENWMRERSDGGWRYGVKYDDKEKTHPLLRPWDQLPDRYRTPDMDWPQMMLNMLNDHGYAILPKEELDRLLTR